MNNPKLIRIGTRGSKLARWQTEHVAELLRQAWHPLEIEIIELSTRGDRVLDVPLPQIGGKGAFTEELEAALRANTIDLAVHSLKDLPTESPRGLMIAAVPARADVRDALISAAGHTLESLPQGATVGTSSRRRGAQLLHVRPDLTLADIRGNIDTRLSKAPQYDAIILAAAGLQRLGLEDSVTQYLSVETMLPAPGQGALAIQGRDDTATHELLVPIQHATTAFSVHAERAFLAALGGGCSLPIAAYGRVDGGTLTLTGRVVSVDGSQQIEVTGAAPATLADGLALGRTLAQQALDQGARALLEATS